MSSPELNVDELDEQDVKDDIKPKLEPISEQTESELASSSRRVIRITFPRTAKKKLATENSWTVPSVSSVDRSPPPFNGNLNKEVVPSGASLQSTALPLPVDDPYDIRLAVPRAPPPKPVWWLAASAPTLMPDGTLSYPCPHAKCQTADVFENALSIIVHMKTFHDPTQRHAVEKLNCKVCPYDMFFKNKTRLEEHLQWHKDGEVIVKKEPSEETQPKKSKIVKEPVKLVEVEHTCPDCGEITASVRLMSQHRRTACAARKANYRALKPKLPRHVRVEYYDDDSAAQAQLDYLNNRRHHGGATELGPMLYCTDESCVEENVGREIERERARGFMNAVQLERHNAQVHKQSVMLTCMECDDGKKFTKSQLSEHCRDRHRPKTLVACVMCGRLLQYLEGARRTNCMFKSRGTGEKFAFGRHMKAHVWMANGEHMCEMGCEQLYFPSAFKRSVHYDEAHGEGSTAEWDREIKPMKKTLTYKEKKAAYDKFKSSRFCTLCNRHFTGTVYFWQDHMQHHDPAFGDFMCSHCPQWYCRSVDLHLSHHKQKHSDIGWVPPKRHDHGGERRGEVEDDYEDDEDVEEYDKEYDEAVELYGFKKCKVVVEEIDDNFG